MAKWIKKGLSMLLAAIMVVSILPIDVLAQSEAEIAQDQTACETHTWSSGVCDVCKLRCAHSADHTQYLRCTICNDRAGYMHSYAEGVCTVCAYACQHQWIGDHCNTCRLACSHSWVGGVCQGLCGRTCYHPSHRYDGQCLTCDAICEHCWKDGKCSAAGCGLTCAHETYGEDSACTVCGMACSHGSYNAEGKCETCGADCTHSAWQDGICLSCGAACLHGSWAAGVCTVCGAACPHDAFDEAFRCAVCGVDCPHEKWNEGKCAVCGVACTHPEHDLDLSCSVCRVENIAQHTWEESVCAVCGLICDHPDHAAESVGSSCGICGGTIAHTWNADDGLCRVCQAACVHDWNGETGECGICAYSCAHDHWDAATGGCTVCGFGCPHENWSAGICDRCGYACVHQWKNFTQQCKICGVNKQITFTYTDGVDGEEVFADQVYRTTGDEYPVFVAEDGTNIPKREDCEFFRWDIVEEDNGDIICIAMWDNNTCKVVYTDGVDDDVVFEDYVYTVIKGGEKPAAPPSYRFNRSGYTFVGWISSTGEDFYKTFEIRQDVTFTAQWKPSPIYVTFTDGVEGEEVFENRVWEWVSGKPFPKFDGYVESTSKPTRNGYTFVKWDQKILPDGNRVHTAVWKSNSSKCEHTLVEIPLVQPTCEKDGSTAGQKCSQCGEITIQPEKVPGGHGHTVIGNTRELWYTVAYTGPQMMTAVQEERAHLISILCNHCKAVLRIDHFYEDYEWLDDGYVLPQKLRYIYDEKTKRTIPDPDTYGARWWVSDEVWTFPANVYGESWDLLVDQEFSAQNYYVQLPPQPIEVQFVDGITGDVLKREVFGYHRKTWYATAPAVPEHEGYVFTHWDKDFQKKPVYTDLTITAQYTNEFTVQFVDGWGNTLKTDTVGYGQPAEAPELPHKEGYTFTGWDVPFDYITSDLTVTALWDEITYHTVTFVDGFGMILKVQTVIDGGAAAAPADPNKEGFRFKGWDVPFDRITSDLTVTALWDEVVYHTVTFVDGRGATLKIQAVPHGGAASAPVVADRPTHRFVGWDVPYDTVVSDLTVTALWSRIWSEEEEEEEEEEPKKPVEQDEEEYTIIQEEEVPLAAVAELLDLDECFAYIHGYGDETVKPIDNMTRAEFVSIIFRLLHDDVRMSAWGTPSRFIDVKAATDTTEEDWYYNEVTVLDGLGLLSHYEGTYFLPNQPITRAEVADILAQFIGDTYEEETVMFPDTEGHWAIDAINDCTYVGIIDGYPDGLFRPDGNIRRNEVAKLFNRMLGRDAESFVGDLMFYLDNSDVTTWYYDDLRLASNSFGEDGHVIPNIRDWLELEKQWAAQYAASLLPAAPAPVENIGTLDDHVRSGSFNR